LDRSFFYPMPIKEGHGRAIKVDENFRVVRIIDNEFWLMITLVDKLRIPNEFK
jgi:hypothetical protein